MAWLQLPKFSSWLAPCDEDKYKAKCKECNKILVAGRSELKKYADTSICLAVEHNLNDKNLCIVVRYYKNDKCIIHLLNLVKMFADNGTAENMYKTFIDCRMINPSKIRIANLNLNSPNTFTQKYENINIDNLSLEDDVANHSNKDKDKYKNLVPNVNNNIIE
ncbi:hypothetical protein ALC53_07196 [Atta colombica]|uniref:Uncharacterized protein n=1 Tax=Atta colombica TaxID=520822 RepID=A0A195BCX2_9HYME|nr:hypothetical protein ALC53_07196 [Atta colombica]